MDLISQHASSILKTINFNFRFKYTLPRTMNIKDFRIDICFERKT